MEGCLCLIHGVILGEELDFFRSMTIMRNKLRLERDSHIASAEEPDRQGKLTPTGLRP